MKKNWLFILTFVVAIVVFGTTAFVVLSREGSLSLKIEHAIPWFVSLWPWRVLSVLAAALFDAYVIRTYWNWGINETLTLKDAFFTFFLLEDFEVKPRSTVRDHTINVVSSLAEVIGFLLLARYIHASFLIDFLMIGWLMWAVLALGSYPRTLLMLNTQTERTKVYLLTIISSFISFNILAFLFFIGGSFVGLT